MEVKDIEQSAYQLGFKTQILHARNTTEIDDFLRPLSVNVSTH